MHGTLRADTPGTRFVLATSAAAPQAARVPFVKAGRAQRIRRCNATDSNGHGPTGHGNNGHSAQDAVKEAVQSGKEAMLGAGKAAKEKLTGRPVVAPSEDFNTATLTTNAGAPVHDAIHSLTAGPRGPVLLEDYVLQEKLSILQQEKVPERTVHARGMVAKGHFEVTHDISDVCCADVFKATGKKTPVAARFSTVTHPKGSPESLRDVRGFSVKFYTSQGNWDFVGNNFPVFWIRDGMQFTDVVRATRPNPKNNIQEGWRILDYLSHFPESTNILTWLLDDAGIPANWRALEGYSVNTYIMMNKEGKETYVKMHWRPKGGAKYLTDQEAKEVGDGSWRHSHATHDLFNTIELGDYPEWEFFIQTMDPADEDKFYFDPLDCTKVWPEDQFPLRPVGRMVLDTNIDSFHAEAEQIAFAPANVVPGITFSNDKLLQARVFSYVDAQRYRIGINYEMLPINQPKCPFHNNHNDGQLNFMHKNEEVNYFPSSVNKKDKPAPASTVTMSQYDNMGPRVRCDYQKEQDEFRQPGERYRTFDEDRKGRFQTQVLKWLAEPKMTDEVRDVWLGYWSQVDASLGDALKQQLPGMINDSSDAKKTNDTKVKTKESYQKNGVLV